MNDVKKLCSLFDAYARTKNQVTAFTELLDSFLLFFKWCNTKEELETQVQQMQLHRQNEALLAIYDEIGRLSEGFHDPLGDLYMEKISTGHMGQFFTPEHVCDLMAAVTVGTLENQHTVLDPACGSGRMLLAAAKINRHLRFFGADIDLLCCKMAVVNMLLQSLVGEISHMNSLTNEFFTGYRIGRTLSDGYYYPWYRELTSAEESVICQVPKEQQEKRGTNNPIVFQTGSYEQGTLF